MADWVDQMIRIHAAIREDTVLAQKKPLSHPPGSMDKAEIHAGAVPIPVMQPEFPCTPGGHGVRAFARGCLWSLHSPDLLTHGIKDGTDVAGAVARPVRNCPSSDAFCVGFPSVLGCHCARRDVVYVSAGFRVELGRCSFGLFRRAPSDKSRRT